MSQRCGCESGVMTIRHVFHRGDRKANRFAFMHCRFACRGLELEIGALFLLRGQDFVVVGWVKDDCRCKGGTAEACSKWGVRIASRIGARSRASSIDTSAT